MQTIRRARLNLPRLIRTLPLAVLSLCLLGSPAQAADPAEGFPSPGTKHYGDVSHPVVALTFWRV